MTKNTNYVSHKKSKVKVNGKPQLPSASVLVEGEIAVNYAENVETLSIKNESGNVVTFSSDNYYTEQKLGSGFTGANSAKTVTDMIVEDEHIIAGALNYLENNKLDVSAYTPVDIENYYTKDETSGKTEISNALGAKVSTTTFTGHTADTSLHFSGSEKENLDALTTNISAISGITADKIGSWDAAASVDLTQYYKKTETSGSTELSTEFAKKADTATTIAGYGITDAKIANQVITLGSNSITVSSATQVNTALGGKSNTGHTHVASEVTDLGAAAKKGVSNGINNTDNLIEAKHIYSGVGVTVAYDTTTHYIQLKSTSGNVLSSFDASAFLVDGMVDSVTLESKSGTTYLVITWNTAAGKTKTELNIGDIFEADNYLTKTDLTATTNYTTVTKANSANTASTVALAGVTGADDLKAIEALTGTSGILKKTAANTWVLDTTSYSSATQVSTALGGKSDTRHTHDDRYYTETEINNKIAAMSGSSTGSASKTITAMSETNGVVTPTYANISITKSQVSDFPSSMTPTAHTHKSNEINSMSGYSKASSASAIVTGDTLNTAIGKLEKALDGKQAKGSYPTTSRKISTASGLTGGGDLSADRTIGLAATGTAGTYKQVVVDAYGRVTSGNTADNNTWRSIKVNGTNFLTDTSTALNLSAGTNVTLTTGSTGLLTISATDTKYTAATAAPGKVATNSASGTSANYARQDHTHGIDLATGDSNGQVKIAGTNVSVKGLGTAAYKAEGYFAGSGHSHTNMVTGSSLTANNIILGNGSSAIKDSGKSIETTLSSTLDTKIPTSKAVATYVTSQMTSVLGSGFTSSSVTEVIESNERITAAALTDLDDRKADTSHTHQASAVTGFTGYSVASSSAAVATTDTLLQVIGKLEKRIQLLETAMGGLKLVKISQTDYDNLPTKDSNTLYVIV